MNKKIIFSLVVVLSFGMFYAPAVFAEEGIMPLTDGEDVTVEGTIDPDDINDEEGTTESNAEENTEDDTESGLVSDEVLSDDGTYTPYQPSVDNGTSDEAEVVCADPNEPGCENIVPEPEMWTLYLSLGALGVTVLLVIIINIIGRHKK